MLANTVCNNPFRDRFNYLLHPTFRLSGAASGRLLWLLEMCEERDPEGSPGGAGGRQVSHLNHGGRLQIRWSLLPLPTFVSYNQKCGVNIRNVKKRITPLCLCMNVYRSRTCVWCVYMFYLVWCASRIMLFFFILERLITFNSALTLLLFLTRFKKGCMLILLSRLSGVGLLKYSWNKKSFLSVWTLRRVVDVHTTNQL